MSVCVNISGTAFSLLLYENVRNDYDQEGFLLGEILRNEKRTITDNDQEVVSIEYTIKINSVLPCPRLGYFYDNAGKINAQQITQLLGNKHDCVVSWYKFKRISSFKPTLREKIVMKQLAAYFMPHQPEHFTWCLLTARPAAINNNLIDDDDKKHVFSQTFIRYHMSAYQPVPMHIANLKDPHDCYKKPAATCSSSTFAQIVRELPQRAHGYNTIDMIETALEERIAATVAALEASENEMHELEAVVKELRRELANEEISEVKTMETTPNEKECIVIDVTSPSTSQARRKLHLNDVEMKENSENVGDNPSDNIASRTRSSPRKS